MTEGQQQVSIYCQNDQHYHEGHMIKYMIIKKQMDSKKTRFLCDDCYLKDQNSYQQYCCNLQELINGQIYEAFKNTKFDSDAIQQFFNYARNHFPYINKEFIINMIHTFQEEIISQIEDMKTKFLEETQKYLEDLSKWIYNPNIIHFFECEDLKKKLLNKEFERSPFNFEELDNLAEKYVEKINKSDNLMKNIDTNKIVNDQKKFLNLEKFNFIFKEVMQTLQIMQERTFTNHQFSQSTLATPYIQDIIKKIAPEKEEQFFKEFKRIYRMTQQGSNYLVLQKVDLLNSDTITIIQTKNKCIFGVYNCLSEPEKSLLFQMNKEKYFQIKKDKKALQLNLQANLKTWILNIGEGDILINSTFTKCTSNLGTAFDIDGTQIFNNKEYLSDCDKFDIYDMEIFQTPPQSLRISPPKLQGPPTINLLGSTIGYPQAPTTGFPQAPTTGVPQGPFRFPQAPTTGFQPQKK